MSHLHFVAAEEYKRRVIQLGEAPDRVFNVGGLGIDAIKRIKLIDQHTLEKSIDFRFRERNLLITFHPVTLEKQSSTQQMEALLSALDGLHDTGLIFTMPNADTGGRELSALINQFVATHPNARVYSSLGQLRYLSCMKFVDGVVGNSSSGIAEAPSFGIGTVNIGDRQKGRLCATSVINCEPTTDRIREALNKLYCPNFRENATHTVNPYGNGGASAQIAKVLNQHSLKGIIKKSFHDLSLIDSK